MGYRTTKFKNDANQQTWRIYAVFFFGSAIVQYPKNFLWGVKFVLDIKPKK